jgi:putative transposase
MNKLNTILGRLQALVSRSRFEKLVKEHKSERKSKGPRSWTQFVAMLFGRLSGRHGLRSIETGMNGQRNSLYHLGIDENTEVKRSTLSYANGHRSAGLYKSLFETALEKARQHGAIRGFRFKNPLYSVDATTIDLRLKLFPRADFRENKGGIKLTVKLDHQGKMPCFAAESNARGHDSKKMRPVPFAANDAVVFGRGYADHACLASLSGQKAWFAARLKKSAKLRRAKKSGATGKSIISGYEIIIPGYSKEKRPRKIIARCPDTGEKTTPLTNDLKWAASTASAVYKGRRQMEVFFKAIKQNLKIKRFYGNSKNAATTQIWTAPIAYLLLYLLKAQTNNMAMSFTNFISVVKTMLFQRTSLFEWPPNPSPPPKLLTTPSVQQEFVW